MSTPIQGFAEHTIWHEIIMFQLYCEERSWPLILASLPLRLSILLSWSFRGFGKPQQSTLNSVTLSLPFIRGLFSRQEAFIISIPPNDDFSYLGCCNLMTVITCWKWKWQKMQHLNTFHTQRISKHLWIVMKKKRYLVIFYVSQSYKKTKMGQREIEFVEMVV